MLSNVLIIILPLFIGYSLVVKQQILLAIIHRLLSAIVYVILFVMGISVSLIDNLQQSLLAILHFSVISVMVILGCNYLALTMLNRITPWHRQAHKGNLPSRLAMALESLKLCVVLVSGFLFGLTRFNWLASAHQISGYVLLFLLLLIGIQLRNSGMTLKQIILNRRGALIALVVTLSSLTAGMINAVILDLPIATGLAMASGYGWYTLSGILMTEAYGPIIGSATFFNDLLHELAAIILLPLLISHNRQAALGICGATSMDFTLPVLQRAGGIEIVPAAIVHGFLLTVAGPLLMALFTSW